MNRETEKGLILVFTGNGKGKTSAALGTITRTLGNNGKVALIQFMKGRKDSSERDLFNKLKGIDIYTFGAGWYKNKTEKKIQQEKAEEGLQKIDKIISSNEYQLVVLDELNYILAYDLLDSKPILDILDKRGSVDIVITGRDAPLEVIEIADTVSEIQEIKHAYKKGISAKKGIDY